MLRAANDLAMVAKTDVCMTPPFVLRDYLENRITGSVLLGKRPKGRKYIFVLARLWVKDPIHELTSAWPTHDD